MTQHEMLAVIRIAEDAHALEPPEGHGGPLTLHCLRVMVGAQSENLGFQPGFLWNSLLPSIPRLVDKGWLEFCDEECGANHFMLTDAGRAQLDDWNAKGCVAHSSKAGRKTSRRSGCAAPKVTLQASPYAAKSAA